MTQKLENVLGILTERAVRVTAVILCLFQIYTAAFGVLPGMQQPVVHLGLVLFLGFLLYQPFGEKTTLKMVANWICGLFILVSMGYLYWNDMDILTRMAQIDPLTTTQFVLGTVALVLTLEITRRTLGPSLPIIAILCIAYIYIAPHLTGVLYYKGMPFDRFIEQIYLTFNGIMGEPVSISATYVFMFVMFGAFLDSSGAGEFFMEFSKSLVGRYRGGPGLMAVVSSALMGTISGSAVANVATTGVFTIPLMKKVGYEKEFAGAVEAVASTGGQILPPVMGAGAFIMAEYVGVPYTTIIKCALIPALLYFFAVFLQVYLEARRLGLPGSPASEIKKTFTVLKESGYLTIPLIVMVAILVSGYSELRSGLVGVVLIVMVSMIKRTTRMSLKKIADTMLSAGKSIIPVASACACAGIVICVIRVSGLGLKFSSAIMQLSGGNLAFALVLTMCSSLILGMGLPTTASYIIQATLAAPALVNMGLTPIQAHLFVFYFACIAVITPPVALAAFTAAPICGGNATRVGVKAFKLGLAAFIVPFAFAYGPSLLMIGSTADIVIALASAILGCVAIAIGLTGWFYGTLPAPFRASMLVASVLLVVPGIKSDLAGIAVMAGTLGVQYFVLRKHSNHKDGMENATV